MDTTIKRLSKGFFGVGGSWLQAYKSRGIEVESRTAEENQAKLEQHILPYFEQQNIKKINKQACIAFRTHLVDQNYANTTINKILSVLRLLLKHAEELGFIYNVPEIKNLPVRTKKKGIPTQNEVNRLLNLKWKHQRAYTAILIAATTAMRIGEILALQLEDINITTKKITVRKSYCSKTKKLKPTKTGHSRVVPIPTQTATAIKNLMREHPHTSGFLFYSDRADITDRPVDRKQITKRFFAAMEEIGIDEEERKRRNITFHSWRHFANTVFINQNLPMLKVQSVTGHNTMAMSQHYYHGDSDLNDIRACQERILDPSIKARLKDRRTEMEKTCGGVYTIEEVASYLQVPIEVLQEAVRDGKMTYIVLGGDERLMRFTHDDVIEYVNASRVYKQYKLDMGEE